jgi:2-keto-3-deoxy-L-rhamnonate aldolase RhmA
MAIRPTAAIDRAFQEYLDEASPLEVLLRTIKAINAMDNIAEITGVAMWCQGYATCLYKMGILDATELAEVENNILEIAKLSKLQLTHKITH